MNLFTNFAFQQEDPNLPKMIGSKYGVDCGNVALVESVRDIIQIKKRLENKMLENEHYNDWSIKWYYNDVLDKNVPIVIAYTNENMDIFGIMKCTVPSKGDGMESEVVPVPFCFKAPPKLF